MNIIENKSIIIIITLHYVFEKILQIRKTNILVEMINGIIF